MEKLANQYTEMQKQNALEKEVLIKKMKDNAQKMKDNATEMQIGDDSKIEEAMILSFFVSLFGDVAQAYNRFKELGLQRKIDDLDKNHNTLQKKLDRLEQGKKKVKMINKYTSLNIEKTALEKKIVELKRVQKENQESGAVEITDQPEELQKSENRLIKVLEEMDKIADFFGYENDVSFMKDLEKSEKKYYGADAAEHLKEIRALSVEKIDALVANIDDFPSDHSKVHELKSAHSQLMEHFTSDIKLSDIEATDLVSNFNSAVTNVEAAYKLNELANHGAEIQKKQEAQEELMQ